MIDRAMGLMFGSGNVIAETAEVFRENAEGAGRRQLQLSEAALQQFAAEFQHPRRGVFDRVMDGVNRLPRPALALGTLGLFVAAMVDPVWFGARMTGIALVPEPLWWLLGAIVSFYFGARHQAKGQDFQRAVAATLALAPRGPLPADRSDPPADDNAALTDWRAMRGH
ncbi:carboxylesterase [Rhodobacteraceae bacterium CCMM004]|nr:carboxylesterase [Rhodobacteraceae bacterium CCMM004]